MKILGINFGHDASVALLDNGRLTRFIELERHTRLKHNLGVKKTDIDALIDGAFDWPDIDLIAVTATQFWGARHDNSIKIEFGYCAEHKRFFENFSSWDQNYYVPAIYDATDPYYSSHLSRRGLTESSPLWERKAFPDLFPDGSPSTAATLRGHADAAERLISTAASSAASFDYILSFFAAPIRVIIGGRVIPGLHVNHHFAHAAYAHVFSSGEKNLIFSHDGGVPTIPFNSGGAFYSWADGICPLYSPKLALGYFYDQASSTAGFNIAEGAGKLMGLAPYGRASEQTHDLVRKLSLYSSPQWRVDISDIDTLVSETAALSAREKSVRSEKMERFDFNFHDRDFSITMAANAQKIVEEVFVSSTAGFVNTFVDRMPASLAVDLVGGFALNCPANSRLQAAIGTTYLNPLPGAIDAGISIGGAAAAAMLVGHRLHRRISREGNDAAFLSSAPISGCPGKIAETFGLARAAFSGDLTKFVAAEIATGKIFCIVRSMSEIGPRALGHRSIVAKASSTEIRDLINRRKGRESWRPLAPLCRREDFSRYFSGDPSTCRFMLFTYRVTSAAIPGVTHCDGSARVQTIEDDDVFLASVLGALDAMGEPPVIVNTSFNCAGEPIVETVAHAFTSFLKLGFDYLMIDDAVFHTPLPQDQRAVAASK